MAPTFNYLYVENSVLRIQCFKNNHAVWQEPLLLGEEGQRNFSMVLFELRLED